MKNFILSTVLLIGMVDRVEGDIVIATIDNSSSIETIELPVYIFPCEISEGDMFYFSHSVGVTEIRCGEPDPG
jgi:hypothetical protein